jgi:DNA invertase Pin-like site-specific DNA recombinase
MSHNPPPPSIPPGTIVALYARDSGGNDQDLSTEQQTTEFMKWCQTYGIIPGKIFIDQARKGSTVVGRTKFLEMMHHFRSGEAQEKAVIIWKYSRFARDVNDSAYYRADLRRLGYIIHSLNDNIPDGPEGIIIEAALDYANQRFLEDLSVDVQRGLRLLVEVYRCVPGTPPKGFKREPVVISKRRDGSDHIAHKWVADPDLIPVIKEAFTLKASGASLTQIHKATKLFGSLNSYTTFFTNRIYIGILEFGDLVIDDYCQPIIDMQTWANVQARIEAHAQARFSSEHPRRTNSVYTLSGLIHCGICGAPMYGNTVTRHTIHGRDEAYRCSNAKSKKECTAGRISRRAVDDLVISVIKEKIADPDNLMAVHQIALESSTRQNEQRQALITANANRRKTISRQIANITRAIAEKGHSTALLDSLTNLEAQRSELQQEHSELQIPFQPVPKFTDQQVQVMAKSISEKLNTATPEELRIVIRSYIQKIHIYRQGKTIQGYITYFYPPEQPPPFENAPSDRITLPISPASVGAPFYRQTFTIPFVYEKTRSK